MRIRPISWLAALVAMLGACNTAPVLPPEDDRVIQLVETDLWSGGEVRVVVRHADGVEDPVTITVDGEALTVVRVDDTTFSATLPVHTGELPVEVAAAGLTTLTSTLSLHGFVSGKAGPGVGGSVLPMPGTGGLVVLGATRDGAASVSLETGQVAATWPRTVHAIDCANGVVPGPAANQVVLRAARASDGSCESHFVTRSIDATGIGPELAQVFPGWFFGIGAVVGPRTAVLGRHDNWGTSIRCGDGAPWPDCQPIGPQDEFFNANLYGFQAGYLANRMLGLGIKVALHDLATGDMVRTFPHFEGGGLMYYHAAAFSPTEDTLYVAAYRTQGAASSSGALLVLNSEDGTELARREFDEGSPIGIAVDAARGLLYVAVYLGEDRTWLEVLERETLETVAVLPAPAGSGGAAGFRFEHHRLVVPTSGDRIYLVSTQYTPWFNNAVIAPMSITQWSLP